MPGAKSRVVRLHADVAARLEKHGRKGETPDATLRRILGLPPRTRKRLGPKPGKKSGGYNHTVTDLGGSRFRLAWEHDVSFGEMRHRKNERATDRDGAVKFARRWGLTLEP